MGPPAYGILGSRESLRLFLGYLRVGKPTGIFYRLGTLTGESDGGLCPPWAPWPTAFKGCEAYGFFWGI